MTRAKRMTPNAAVLMSRFLRGGTHSVTSLAGESSSAAYRFALGDRLRAMARAGWIEPVETHTTDGGNRAAAYRITDAGREAYARSVDRLRGAA